MISKMEIKTKTCLACLRPMPLNFYRRRGRPWPSVRDNEARLLTVCQPCRQELTEWCAICEEPCSDLDALVTHMREKHDRLILDIDINRKNEEERAARLRLMEEMEEVEEALIAQTITTKLAVMNGGHEQPC